MNITFLSSAEDEFLEAIAYYNQQSEGLGFEFALEVERTLERILQYPEAKRNKLKTARIPHKYWITTEQNPCL